MSVLRELATEDYDRALTIENNLLLFGRCLDATRLSDLSGDISSAMLTYSHGQK